MGTEIEGVLNFDSREWAGDCIPGMDFTLSNGTRLHCVPHDCVELTRLTPVDMDITKRPSEQWEGIIRSVTAAQRLLMVKHLEGRALMAVQAAVYAANFPKGHTVASGDAGRVRKAVRKLFGYRSD